MTATERARRSDALYYETVSVNRRVLCDMVANREADLEDARAENAKLRDGANAMRQLYEDELKHALADNAKLRELVKSMYYDLTNMTFPPDWVTDYAADMRELGVEEDA